MFTVALKPRLNLQEIFLCVIYIIFNKCFFVFSRGRLGLDPRKFLSGFIYLAVLFLDLPKKRFTLSVRPVMLGLDRLQLGDGDLIFFSRLLGLRAFCFDKR